MLELEWSPDALDDLDEIYDSIAEDDVDAADKMIAEIRELANICRDLGNIIKNTAMKINFKLCFFT